MPHAAILLVLLYSEVQKSVFVFLFNMDFIHLIKNSIRESSILQNMLILSEGFNTSDSYWWLSAICILWVFGKKVITELKIHFTRGKPWLKLRLGEKSRRSNLHFFLFTPVVSLCINRESDSCVLPEYCLKWWWAMLKVNHVFVLLQHAVSTGTN